MCRIQILLLLLALSQAVTGQRPYQRQHGLFSGREDYRVESMLQDSTGILWFGTDKGLFRYDGFTYERYTVADGLAEDWVTSMCWIHRDLFWIGHRGGAISLFDGTDFIPFEPEEGMGEVEITDISVGPEGRIWYATLGEGMFRYDGRHLANLDIDDGLSDNYVYDIELDQNGELWLATDYGISHFTGDTFRLISMKDGLPDNIVRALEFSEGRLWLGTHESGISALDLNTGEIVHYGNWEYGPVTDIVAGPGRQILVSTERRGLIEMSFKEDSLAEYKQVTESEGLISNSLNTILVDSEENIWIGGRRGIVQLLPPLFEFLDKESGLPFERANSLLKDAEGNLWVSSELGIYRGVPNASGRLLWENISDRLGLNGASFISLYEDPDHHIWAGSLGLGLIIIDPETMTYTPVDKSRGLSDDNIIHISGDDLAVWISTLGGGVIKYDLAEQKYIQFNQSTLKGNYIYSTRTDQGGRVWVAASLQYPNFIQNDSLHALSDSIFLIPPLFGIAIDSTGDVWFNTLSDGILRLGESGIEHLGAEQGIDFQEIQSIVFDKHNKLLIFANSGMQILDTENGSAVHLDEKTGLGYRYPLLNSVYKDRDGQIWFGTSTGIIKYNPDFLYITEQEPRVHLSFLRLYDSALDRDRTSFNHSSNNFSFGFNGIWYKFPEMMTFRHQLEGYDLDWHYYLRNREINYPNLPPGHYTFRVEVSIDGQNWIGPEEGTYTFRILPPFWKRWWFVVSMVLSAILLLFIYIRLRVANLEKAKRELEKQVQLRTEQIASKNQELELQKEKIATQRDIAEMQRDQIRHQRDQIRSSIMYAERIQSAAHPPEAVMKNMLPEHFIFNRPRDIVSGDFYWAARGKEHIYFAVADCTGHGVPGAFLSMLGISSLNEIVKSMEDLSAARVLDQLARRIRESLHQTDRSSEDTSVDGMDIALCSFHPEKDRLEFAGANNHLYLVRGGDMKVIRADMQDISSKYESPKPFTNHRIKVKDGDMIYLFTDGFPDQFGGKERKKFKYWKFRKLLLDIHQESVSKQEMLLSLEFNRWKGDNEQIDDVLVMGVRIPRA